MERSEIYNGSQWAHDIFLVSKAGAIEYITDQSSTVFFAVSFCSYDISRISLMYFVLLQVWVSRE